MLCVRLSGIQLKGETSHGIAWKKHSRIVAAELRKFERQREIIDSSMKQNDSCRQH